ncbi:MAG: hypothetical protein AAGF57_06590 [Pseudomonadota bacterium]
MRILTGLSLLLFFPGLWAQSELLLGTHTDEPAPTIGALLVDNPPEGFTITLRPFANVGELRSALADGSIDLALLEETGDNEANAALITELYPSVLHVLTRGDQTSNDIGEVLRDKPIWGGAPGSIGHRVARALARDFGIPTENLNLLKDAWTVEPDVYFIFGGLLAPDALSRLDGFALYSFDSPNRLMHGSVVEGIALRYPNLRPFTLPAQLYPELSAEPALTLSVSNLLVAGSTIDDETAYALAANVETLKGQLAALYPMAGMPQLAAGAHHARAMPLQPGVQRFRDRDLPGFFERNAEILGMMATVFLAVGSALIAWRRQRRQARKDKLDTYYSKLLTYRTALIEGTDTPFSVAQQARATQSDVLKLVIDERIDANGALLAFLSLSNQILTEAHERG